MFKSHDLAFLSFLINLYKTYIKMCCVDFLKKETKVFLKQPCTLHSTFRQKCGVDSFSEYERIEGIIVGKM